MIKIGILASHNGSGFVALQEAIKKGDLKAKIELVITNNSDANVIKTAENYGIKALVVNSKYYPEIDLDELIYKLFREKGCHYIFLSGYMKKIGSIITQNFDVINSHPALLPKFGGKGMYGRNVHTAVIDAKEKESGCTIHYVNEEYDKGEIILQKSVQLDINETVLSLEDKIKHLEGIAIVEAFNSIL